MSLLAENFLACPGSPYVDSDLKLLISLIDLFKLLLSSSTPNRQACSQRSNSLRVIFCDFILIKSFSISFSIWLMDVTIIPNGVLSS